MSQIVEAFRAKPVDRQCLFSPLPRPRPVAEPPLPRPVTEPPLPPRPQAVEPSPRKAEPTPPSDQVAPKWPDTPQLVSIDLPDKLFTCSLAPPTVAAFEHLLEQLGQVRRANFSNVALARWVKSERPNVQLLCECPFVEAASGIAPLIWQGSVADFAERCLPEDALDRILIGMDLSPREFCTSSAVWQAMRRRLRQIQRRDEPIVHAQDMRALWQLCDEVLPTDPALSDRWRSDPTWPTRNEVVPRKAAQFLFEAASAAGLWQTADQALGLFARGVEAALSPWYVGIDKALDWDEDLDRSLLAWARRRAPPLPFIALPEELFLRRRLCGYGVAQPQHSFGAHQLWLELFGRETAPLMAPKAIERYLLAIAASGRIVSPGMARQLQHVLADMPRRTGGRAPAWLIERAVDALAANSMRGRVPALAILDERRHLAWETPRPLPFLAEASPEIQEAIDAVVCAAFRRINDPANDELVGVYEIAALALRFGPMASELLARMSPPALWQRPALYEALLFGLLVSGAKQESFCAVIRLHRRLRLPLPPRIVAPLVMWALAAWRPMNRASNKQPAAVLADRLASPFPKKPKLYALLDATAGREGTTLPPSIASILPTAVLKDWQACPSSCPEGSPGGSRGGQTPDKDF